MLWKKHMQNGLLKKFAVKLGVGESTLKNCRVGWEGGGRHQKKKIKKILHSDCLALLKETQIGNHS